MILQSVTLQQFRSYIQTTLKFSDKITLIVGPNAVGKTNILEAVSLIASGKSFRADRETDMIRWGSELGRITAQTLDDKLEIMITTGSVNGKAVQHKKYVVNGVPRRMVDFVGKLPAVLFWPEHLELVTDSPSHRRKYLDSVLMQVDREYRRNVQSYERGVRQRNKLLELIQEGAASRNQLLFWNQLLIKSGGYITDARSALIDYINSFQLPAVSYQLLYDKSVISEARLEKYASEEVAAKSTLVGPHRDDMIFQKKQKDEYMDLNSFGSRGEQRMAVLWIKLAELSYIQQKCGQRPILLLDDIFSELDEDHKKLVLEIIAKQQTIITSADEDIRDMLEVADESALSIIHLPLGNS
jgi:DNA replication and repair protein RecF